MSARRSALTRVSRQDLAVYRPIWQIVGAMYVLFAVVALLAAALEATDDAGRNWLLAAWLAAAGALHLSHEPPAIGDPANHLALACASVTVAAAFVGTQPGGALAIGGAMFVAPLVAVRLQRRRQIAAHIAFASSLLLLVAASGVVASVVDLATVLAAGLLALAFPALAMSCAAVLEAAEIQGAELGRAVRRDQLTGAGNRRLFDEQLASEIERHRRRGQELSLVLVDLDQFSAAAAEDVSAAHGLLREVATAIAGYAPAAACVARLDGDEFAALLPCTSPLQARNCAAAIQHAVRRLSRPDGSPLTACLGWASLPTEAVDSSELLRVADARMRDAKQARAVAWTGPASGTAPAGPARALRLDA